MSTGRKEQVPSPSASLQGGAGKAGAGGRCQPPPQAEGLGAKRRVLTRGSLSCLDRRSNKPPRPETLFRVCLVQTLIQSSLLTLNVIH